MTKLMDIGSPSWAHACAIKAQFDKAILSLTYGGKVYLTVRLEKVMITSVKVEYTTGDPRPVETVTLSYRKATWRYGTATTSYDLIRNK